MTVQVNPAELNFYKYHKLPVAGTAGEEAFFPAEKYQVQKIN